MIANNCSRWLHRYFSTTNNFSINGKQVPSILVTGALGQLGSKFVPFLKQHLPMEANVIATDIRKPFTDFPSNIPFFYTDVLNKPQLESLIVEYRVGIIVHLSALLSAIGEEQPQRALDINLNSVHTILELAKNHSLQLLIPSTIGAFGPSTPKRNTPDITIMRPTTIYGITKLHMELMGEYYHRRYNVDFRSVRLPGVLSTDSIPGGGTTDYAIHMMLAALKSTSSKPVTYTCFLSENTRLPMMHLQDALQGLFNILFSDSSKLTQRVYNIGAMDFTPLELATLIKKNIPHFEVNYVPDKRQTIADSWPYSLDDSKAREDWNWSPKWNLNQLVEEFIKLKLD